MPLSPRAVKAREILMAGGEYCIRLERNSYTGIAKFQYRLFNAERKIVRGYGFATYNELYNELVPVAGGSTSVSTYYKHISRSPHYRP